MINKILNRLEVLAGIKTPYEETARGLSEENFKALSPTGQIKYIKEHPNSKYGKDPKWLKRAKMLKTRMLNQKKGNTQKGAVKPISKPVSKSSTNLKSILGNSKNKVCRAFKNVDFDKLKQLQQNMFEEEKRNKGAKAGSKKSYKAFEEFTDYLDNNISDSIVEDLGGMGHYTPYDWFGDTYGVDYDIDKLRNDLIKKAGVADKPSKDTSKAIEKIKSFKPNDAQIKRAQKQVDWYKDRGTCHYNAKDRAWAENLFKEYTKLDSKLDPNDTSTGVAGVRALDPILKKMSSGKLEAFKSILEEENWHTALDEVDSNY